MTTVYDVRADALIAKAAEDLKDKVEAPVWSSYVKTSCAKEKAPQDENWWYTREASILRKIYVNGPIGISRLRDLYKSKKNKGVQPEKSKPAGGKITRLAVQQLEGLGFIKKAQANKGREITAKGRSYLDNLANQVA